MDYCSLEQLVGRLAEGEAGEMSGYLPQVTSEEDKAALAELITRVSRRIDAYVTDGQAENFFAASPAGATEGTFYGDGCSYLWLPEFVPGSVSKLVGLRGVEIETFVEQPTGLQLADADGVLTRGAVFGDGVPYKVTARFGFAAIPADINEAALQLSVRTYRSKDEGFSGVIGAMRNDGAIIERAMPVAVKEILDVHRRKYRGRRIDFA